MLGRPHTVVVDVPYRRETPRLNLDPDAASPSRAPLLQHVAITGTMREWTVAHSG